MKIDFNGHFGRNQKHYKDLLQSSIKFWEICQKENLPEEIKKRHREISLPHDAKECPECGANLNWKQTKNNLKVTTKCKYPGGYPKIVFTVKIPSGKMVIGNDFRDLFQVMDSHYINHTIGIVRTVKDYAKINLAHAFVGNTCPSMFKMSDEKFIIGQKGANGKNPAAKAKRVAGICTDLWWYSIADYDDFIKRGGKLEENTSVDVVKCKPGVYQFTHQYHLLNHDDYKSPKIYTEIKWVKSAKKLFNHQAEFMKLNFTAEQVMHSLFRTKPDFYGSPEKLVPGSYADSVSTSMSGMVTKKEWPYYFTAERMLCTYGGGFKWHPNGWGTEGNTPQPREREVKIPIFNKPFKWGQPCEYSALSEMVKPHRMGNEVQANPSFVRLGFNILQCILKYGAYEYTSTMGKELRKDGPTTQWAKEIYPLMVSKYGKPNMPHQKEERY